MYNTKKNDSLENLIYPYFFIQKSFSEGDQKGLKMITTIKPKTPLSEYLTFLSVAFLYYL